MALFEKNLFGNILKVRLSVTEAEDDPMEEAEARLEELEEELAMLWNLVSDHDSNQPEEGTSAYRRWQARCQLFEAQIEEVETETDQVNARLEELEDLEDIF